MFTGLVEETGSVVAFSPGPRAWSLEVTASVVLADLAQGDSIAVNGCCLTVTRIRPDSLGFDVLEETRRLTNLSSLAPGSLVNLERSLRFDGKVGGHFVTGHIDGTGRVAVFEERGADRYLEVVLPPGTLHYVIHKGSIAIDGISLTIAAVSEDRVGVWLIPHTINVTNLRERRVGDAVNLEFDLLGKYVERMLSVRSP